jgi:hypothetical protein
MGSYPTTFVKEVKFCIQAVPITEEITIVCGSNFSKHHEFCHAKTTYRQAIIPPLHVEKG